MRTTAFIAALGMTLLLATGAQAVTRQSASVPGGSGAVGQQLVDPDEQTERLVDQSRQNALRSTYDRGSAASVMDFGNRPRGGTSPR